MNQIVSVISAIVGCPKNELSLLVLGESSSLICHNSIFRWIVKTDGNKYLFPSDGYKSFYTISINDYLSLKPHLVKAYEIAKSFSMIEKKPQIDRKK